MTEFLNTSGRISTDTPFVARIEDNIEGDMLFSFKLKEDDKKHSYTTYDAINSHEALLTISNVKGNGVQSSDPICVGTYQGKFLLYVTFVVFAKDNGWDIDVHFMKKATKDGDKC